MARWTRSRRRALLLEMVQWFGALAIVAGIASSFVGSPHPELFTGGVGLVLLKHLGGEEGT